ncbi:hypothetical protein IWW55_006181 [Coemansia sp. RSA 2706]|nr:hypothetical protein IWW55_006181 [Coemansia sp. RSA 2706]KAJ2309751.1 hypothetical protein IWW54_003566 [Coemansia sp. RSA 2705]
MSARAQQRLTGHTGSVNAAVFDSTGDYVVSGGQDKQILLSNASTGRQVQAYHGHGWAVQGVAVSQDSSQLASCGGDRMVFVWDISTTQIKRKLTGHRQRVDCVATNGDGSIVASGSFDKTVCIWDLRAAPRTPLQVLKESKDGVASLVLTESEIIAGSIDGCVRTYDMRNAKVVEDSLESPVVSVSVAGSQQGRLLAGCMDSTIQLLDREGDGRAVAAFVGHKCAEYRIQCDSNGQTVVSGSEDGFVYQWDIASGGEIIQHTHRLAGHSGIVNSVKLHPRATTDARKSRAMVSAGSDGSVIVWG